MLDEYVSHEYELDYRMNDHITIHDNQALKVFDERIKKDIESVPNLDVAI